MVPMALGKCSDISSSPARGFPQLCCEPQGQSRWGVAGPQDMAFPGLSPCRTLAPVTLGWDTSEGSFPGSPGGACGWGALSLGPSPGRKEEQGRAGPSLLVTRRGAPGAFPSTLR